MTRSAIVLGIFFGAVVLLPGVGHSYREDESEQAIDADINRGEDALVRRVLGAGERVIEEGRGASEAEVGRDVELIRGLGDAKPDSPRNDDDSIAEIERDVEALTPQ